MTLHVLDSQPGELSFNLRVWTLLVVLLVTVHYATQPVPTRTSNLHQTCSTSDENNVGLT